MCDVTPKHFLIQAKSNQARKMSGLPANSGGNRNPLAMIQLRFGAGARWLGVDSAGAHYEHIIISDISRRARCLQD